MLEDCVTSWLAQRDREQPADPRATGEYARLGRGIAYTSPIWLQPSPRRV